jgi:MFS family permease
MATRQVVQVILPLVLAQFIASYAASNMNVAINDIARDIGTSVQGVQTAITLFTLTMAALMIPGSKLTDIWGRKRCFQIGMIVYGAGALIAALSQQLGVMILGYSILEGVGSALMIPPIYILTTVAFSDLTTRAKAFGLISAAAGLGAAAGPLIGGLITSTISWRASFGLQFLVVIYIIILGRKIVDPGVQGKKPAFDFMGAILSAAGLLFVVLGILLAGDYGWFKASKDFLIGSTVLIHQGSISPVWLFVGIGALLLLLFFGEIYRREKAGKQPLLSIRLFKSRRSNLGLITQNVQWLTMQGSFFVISVFLQTVHSFSAIQTGLTLSPAIIGILISSVIAGRLAQRRSQRTLVRVGFVITIASTTLMILLHGPVWFALALLLMGLGIGVMLTSSVNVVQSSFPEKDQGEISGLSRSISNLGSSLGTAIVGTVLVSAASIGNKSFGLAMITMIVIGLIGLVAALLLPPTSQEPVPKSSTQESLPA